MFDLHTMHFFNSMKEDVQNEKVMLLPVTQGWPQNSLQRYPQVNLDTKDEWPLKDVAEWDLAAAALVNAGEVPPKKRLEDLRVVTRAKPEGDRVERWL